MCNMYHQIFGGSFIILVKYFTRKNNFANIYMYDLGEGIHGSLFCRRWMATLCDHF